MREQRLLGVLVPEALGGEGAGAAEVADVCYTLGRACASTAMIFAMHQTKVACLARHSHGESWHRGLQRHIAGLQLLMASSTTEGGGGGNIRSSEAAIRNGDDRITLERNASVISYGADADGIVTTARRSESSEGSDQVLVAFLKDQYSLERTQSWDTLGMRGTCSVGFILRASGGPDQVLPDPYERIHVQTMMPFAHIFWSSVWAGVAACPGLPATSIPIGLAPEGLPIGVQIVGPWLEDRTPLKLAELIEETHGGFVPPPAFA